MIREKADANTFGKEFTLALREIAESADTPRTRAIKDAVFEYWIQKELKNKPFKPIRGTLRIYNLADAENAGYFVQAEMPRAVDDSTAQEIEQLSIEDIEAFISIEDGIQEIIQVLPIEYEAFAKESSAKDSILNRGRSMVEAIMKRPDMLTVDEMAERTKLARSTVYNYINKHQLLAFKVSKSVRLPEWQIDERGLPFEAMPQLLKRAHGSAWDLYRVLTAGTSEESEPYGVGLLKQGKSEQLLEYLDTALPE